MKCWICKRQARGYGHADLRHPVGDARRYPMDWVFCSRRCQQAFHALYGQWRRVQEGYIDKTEVAMIDPSDVERAAMWACLKDFGAAAEAIGFDKPLGAYSEAEALQVIDAIVTGYTEAMVAHHEASKYPPVRGLKDSVSDPFADLEDDLPWEEPESASKAPRKEARR
ncbi:DUF6511 domain-containing protein [Sinimarinibacterium thermocellulolyticum]|uniref:DUF6511 domain-containing protein n=1 Tax=Sinimarinibacterium thermocellulolyticum TaxID=3170016 RepID=A0ABV2AE01_9GAMM